MLGFKLHAQSLDPLKLPLPISPTYSLLPNLSCLGALGTVLHVLHSWSSNASAVAVVIAFVVAVVVVAADAAVVAVLLLGSYSPKPMPGCRTPATRNEPWPKTKTLKSRVKPNPELLKTPKIENHPKTIGKIHPNSSQIPKFPKPSETHWNTQFKSTKALSSHQNFYNHKPRMKVVSAKTRLSSAW